MAPLAGLALLAHGGLIGLFAESLVVLAIGGVFLAVFIRERRSGGAADGPARLRDEDEA